MSENKFDFTVESIVAEMGIDEKFLRKTIEKPQVKIVTPENESEILKDNKINYAEKNENIAKVANYEKLSKKMKKNSNIAQTRAKIILILLILSTYLSVATINDLALPKYFKLVDYPYIFTLVNIILHIIALVLSVDVISDGFRKIFTPNINTLIAFTSFSILIHKLSILFLEKPIIFLPFTPVAIYVLYKSAKSTQYVKKSKSYVYKICSMTSGLAFIEFKTSKQRRYVLKRTTLNKEDFGKNVAEDDKNELITTYFCAFLLFSVPFSIYIAGEDISIFFWCLSALSSICIPINYILGWALPYKYAAKKLFGDGVAIKSYRDIKKMHKCNTISLTDLDLFAKNTIYLEEMILLGYNLENEVLSYVASGFSKLNSCTKYVFEEELKKRYLQPLKCQKIDLIDENGFTFTVNNKKVSVGNADFVKNLGISIKNDVSFLNPIYVVISSKISAIISIKHIASPRLYNSISKLEQNSVRLIVSTLDFTINQDLIARIYDIPLNSVIFDEFITRYSFKQEEKPMTENILLTRQTGKSYINSFIMARKLVITTKTNYFLGFLCSFIGIGVVSSLLYNFSPTLLLPQNVLIFLFLWCVPTNILSYIYNNV